MKQTFYPLCLALGLLATACSSDSPTLPDNQPENALKTPITFSSGIAGGSVGRATVTTGSDHGFTAATEMVMHIRSAKKDGSESDKRYTRTTATAQIGYGTPSSVTFDANDYRYWDDAYGRAAQLSVFAVAVADKKFDATSLNGNSLPEAGNNGWTETAPTNGHTLTWTVSETQTETTIAQEDLVYSNNIQGSNVMKFNLNNDAVQDGPGTFKVGQLKFDHALTRITVKLKEGTGFDSGSDTDFKFDSDKEIELLNMPYTGTLDVAAGTWTSTTTPTVKTAEQSTESGFNYIRSAQVLPDYVITKDDNNTNMMQFTIDKNTYYVTQAMVFTALNGQTGVTVTDNKITMEQGKNYIFTLTVKKTGITLTAKVAEWLDVTATGQDVENANGRTMDFYTTGSACNSFDLYRLLTNTENSTTATWGGNYTDANKFSTDGHTASDGKWTTGWYFETSNSYYHFRTVNVGTDLQASGTDDPDYFTITSGAVNNDPSTGNDYHWGAPIKSDASNIEHNPTKGYEDYILPAINATVTPIGITEFHTMSDIHVVLKTTDGDDAVKLFNDGATPNKHTTVTLMRYYPKGTVLMGNGLVSRTGDPVAAAGTEITAPSEDNSTNYYETANTESKHYTYRVVPQALDYDTDQHIGLEILTPDGNKYFINQLSTITKDGGSAIDRWYPGKKYTYTFTLKKTGINVTCTVANWQNITASDTNVDLTK